MADPKIRIKRSAVAGRIPSVDQVPLGELALNTWDGQLYASKNVGLGTTVVAVNPWLVGTGTDSYNAYFTAGNIGIGSTTPTSALHVVGDAYISGVVTANAGFNLGISSAGSVITSGPIKTLNFIGAGNTFLVNGTTVDISIQGGGGGGAEIGVQANDSVIGYAQTTLNFAGTGVTGVSIGTTTTITIEPGLVGAAKSVTSFTATAGQTTFNVNYSQGQENVFLNGVRLSESQYTATNGSTVVLNDAASDGDSVDIVVYLRGSDPNRNVEVTLLPPFNGITTAFTMYKGTTSYLFDPIDERQIVVSLGGVIQQPGVAYTVGTGSSIFFSAAPGAATTCFITALYSNTVGVPTDAVFINKEVFNPTGVQTTFTIASGYTDSNIDIYRNGIRLVNGADYTATNGTTVDLVTPATGGDVVETVAYRTYIPPYFGNVKIGVGGTDLLVEGNARVTGILTVGPGSITFDGVNNKITGTNLGIGNSSIIIDSADRVGIGSTITGTSKLTVEGGDITLDYGCNKIYFRNTPSNPAAGGIIQSDRNLSFHVAEGSTPTHAVTIERDTLNVGIGTTAPKNSLGISKIINIVGSTAGIACSSTLGNVSGNFYSGVSAVWLQSLNKTQPINHVIGVGNTVHLQVKNAGNSRDPVLIVSNDGGNYGKIQLSTGSTNFYIGGGGYGPELWINSGDNIYYNAAAGDSHDFAVNDVIGLTVNKNQQVGIGSGATFRSSFNSRLSVETTDSATAPAFSITRVNSSVNQFAFYSINGGDSPAWTNIIDSVNSNLRFISLIAGGSGGNIEFFSGVTPTQNMTIDYSDQILMHTTSSTIDSSNFGQVFYSSNFVGFSRNVNGGSSTMSVYGNAGEFRIMGDGDALNTNNSYGPISSDERLKQDIQDSGSQWEDIKNIQIKKFRYRDKPNDPLQLGPIAQELQQVCPNLIKSREVTKDDLKVNSGLGTMVDDLDQPIYDQTGEIIGYEQKVQSDTMILSFKSSILYMKAVKALQEALVRIESLESEVSVLKSQVGIAST